MTERLRVELHSHTVWSKDCLVEFDTIIERCQARGIDRIAITDHNTAEGALALQKLAPELVIVGEEIMTSQGEILGYFMQESIPKGLSPEEAIRRLREQGAVISVSHPFDRLRKGAWREADLRRIIDQVDAIEVFNSRCAFNEDNRRAEVFAREQGLCATVGSDAHIPPEYGQATALLRPFADAESFRAALQDAQFDIHYSPNWVHFGSTYAKWMKRLGFRQRLWAGG